MTEQAAVEGSEVRPNEVDEGEGGSPAAGDLSITPLRTGDENEQNLERYRQQLSSGQYLDRLKGATAGYLETQGFKSGEVVQWKDLLKDTLYPDYGAPATFIRYLTEEDRSQSSLFPLFRPEDDCLIGYLDGDLDFAVIATRSSRLMPWSE